MARKRGKAARGANARSAEQQFGSAVFTRVMKAWEELTDEEHLAWHVEAKDHRTTGVNYFRSVNLRRLRRGEELARVPAPPKSFNAKPLLKGLHIINRGGRIRLMLAVSRAPTEPTTIWGSRPCNRGWAKPDKCPRLGWFPPSRGGRLTEITALYFNKHGDYIREHRVPLVGKRIFIRARQELDSGAPLYEQVAAVVPPPEAWGGKRGPFPS